MNENPDLVRDYLSKEMKCGGILGPFIIPSTVFFSAYVLLVFYLRRFQINFKPLMIFITQKVNRSICKFWKMNFEVMKVCDNR